MKNKLLIFIAVVSTVLLASCKVNTYYSEARYGYIVLDSLTRADVDVVGVCTAEATITKSSTGLDKQYAKQYKQGKYNNFISVATAPTIINSSFLSKVFGKLELAQDPGRDFVMYALFEKYPDVDYFAGVTINRTTSIIGNNNITETLTVKAIGIKLKTDL
jgi:hypothetical protein